MKSLESVDEHLLRSLVKAHSKTPLEFLYLETGAAPIRFLISSRRMIYLQTIVKRSDNEVTKKIYQAQKDDPVKGDYIELVKADFELIEESLDESVIMRCGVESYKSFIKAKVRKAALKHLNKMKEKHSKIKAINYSELKPQEYLISPIFNDENVSLLFSLRSRYVECKANFKSRYRDDDLKCPFCTEDYADQKHMLGCKVLSKHITSDDLTESKAVYEDIFNEVRKQKTVTLIFKGLIDIRKKLVNDPSTSDQVLKTSIDLRDCIDIFSSGK